MLRPAPSQGAEFTAPEAGSSGLPNWARAPWTMWRMAWKIQTKMDDLGVPLCPLRTPSFVGTPPFRSCCSWPRYFAGNSSCLSCSCFLPTGCFGTVQCKHLHGTGVGSQVSCRLSWKMGWCGGRAKMGMDQVVTYEIPWNPIVKGGRTSMKSQKKMVKQGC